MGNCCGNNDNEINTKDQLFLNRSVARFNVIKDIKAKTNSKFLLKTSNIKKIKPKVNSELNYNEEIEQEHYFQQIINFYLNKYNQNISDLYSESETNRKNNDKNGKIIEKINLETIWNIYKKEQFNNTNSKFIIFSLIKVSNTQFNYLKYFQWISFTIEEIASFSNEKLLNFKNFINGKILLVLINQETNFNSLDLLYEIYVTNNFSCFIKIVNFNFVEFENNKSLNLQSNHKDNRELDNIGHFTNGSKYLNKNSGSGSMSMSMSARNLFPLDNFSLMNQSVLSSKNEFDLNRFNILETNPKEFNIKFDDENHKETINSYHNKVVSNYSLIDEIKDTNSKTISNNINMNIQNTTINNQNTLNGVNNQKFYKNNVVKEFLNDNLDLYEFSKMPYIMSNLNYFKNMNLKSFVFFDFINENVLVNDTQYKPDLIKTIFNKRIMKRKISDKEIVKNKLVRFVNFFKLTGVLVIKSENLRELKESNYKSFYQNGEHLLKIISKVKYLDDLKDNITEIINSLILFRNLVNQQNSIVIYFDDVIKQDTLTFLICIIMFFLTDTTPRNLSKFNELSFLFIENFQSTLIQKLNE